ncbi:MAG: hypothetical protein ACRDIB_10400 [Ardenticatenaceae bacterium]
MTTLNLQVGANTDDAREHTGFDGCATDNLKSGAVSGTYYAGARFTGANIPSGATIDICVTKWTERFWDGGSHTNTVLFQDDTPNPATFGCSGNSPKDRVDGALVTSNSAAWAFTEGGPDAEHTSPSLVTPLQEAVDDAGGLDEIVLILDGTGASEYKPWFGYEQSTTKAPKLDVTYTAGAGPSGPPAGSLALLGVGA